MIGAALVLVGFLQQPITNYPPVHKVQADSISKTITPKSPQKAVEAPQAAPAAQPVPTPTPAPTPVVAPVDGSPEGLMAQAGIDPSDFGAVEYIVSHEGAWWGVERYNDAGSGAYGLCQALPGDKMAAAGADWATNPVTQLRWCDSYAKSRYGGWWSAYNYWVNNGNW